MGESVNKALSDSQELRAEKDRLIAMRNTLAAGSPGTFGARFAERVIERIHALDDLESSREFFFQSLYRLFRPIACAAATAALAIMTLNMLERGEVSLAAAFALPQEEIGTILEEPP
ncbi:MAG: hypothetical protein A2Z06_04370 [Candidatus Glassbacteria bacterium RBG_16_58_8]|uniref:Uncharacterized protein n=1 Tax=Candidatus Glassbacteria bacterium RBG_16_58_8 TaxID=1817866 RepID=A0A1F5YCM3_9BACT|nr:MAG: hypothetical protein A2Z06_04370 [Candidatus Glassbacteria bacterium RBG_16_58_8]